MVPGHGSGRTSFGELTGEHSPRVLEPASKGFVVNHRSAKDRFRSRQRALSPGGGNASSCPLAVIPADLRTDIRQLRWMCAVDPRFPAARTKPDGRPEEEELSEEPRDGLLSQPTAVARPWTQERVFVPHSGHRRVMDQFECGGSQMPSPPRRAACQKDRHHRDRSQVRVPS